MFHLHLSTWLQVLQPSLLQECISHHQWSFWGIYSKVKCSTQSTDPQQPPRKLCNYTLQHSGYPQGSSWGVPTAPDTRIYTPRQLERPWPDVAMLQWLKKLTQCFTVWARSTWHKTSILHNILKIIYVILHHLRFLINPRSCDLDKNWLNAK